MEPHTNRAGRPLGNPPSRPPLRADGETEARRGQGLSRETSAPKLSASEISNLCGGLGSAGERKGLLHFFSGEGENWPRGRLVPVG